MRTVSDLFVQCLENEGVTTIFGVPGEENEDLLFSLDKSAIQFIPCRHEQGAAFMADVWGRLTGKAGVCLATLGPGATNLITGVADADLDNAPLVAITAQGSLSRLHHESHQYLDIVSMFKPITKWNASISDPVVVTEVVRKAFKVAQYEKPGATHIELPEDVARQSISDKVQPIAVKPIDQPVANTTVISQVVARLTEVQRPLVLVGQGVLRASASETLTNLITQFNLPIVSTFMGKGAVSDHLPQSLFSIGLGFKDYVIQATQAADLIITIGYDIAEYPPESWNPSGDKPIIHVDTAPAEVYANYTPAVEVIGDIEANVTLISTQLKQARLQLKQHWYQPVRDQIAADIKSYDLKDNDAFTIPGALNIIRRLLPDDGLLISDVGSHKMWIARNFPTYCPAGCLISNGLAAMGFALPGAIAASLVDSKRPIIAAMGDGGFMMNVQELETAHRLGATFVAIIFNDNDYGLISWKQRQSQGKSVSTTIGNPNFKQLAESFNLTAYRPENVAELEEQLRQALAANTLSVIEIPVDPQVNDDLIEKLETYWQNQ